MDHYKPKSGVRLTQTEEKLARDLSDKFFKTRDENVWKEILKKFTGEKRELVFSKYLGVPTLDEFKGILPQILEEHGIKTRKGS
jgi:hypothetical protein